MHLPGVALRVLRVLRARAALALAVVAALIVIAGPGAMLDEARARRIDLDYWEALYSTLGLFAFSSNKIGFPDSWSLRVLYFAAPAVAASAVFGAFYRILEERMPLLLGRATGHVVIGGLGNLGTVLGRYQVAHGHVVVAIERSADAPAVADMRAAGATVVLIGDMTSRAMLQRARAARAGRVFFASQSDVANLDGAFQVRRLAEGQARRGPTIYAHVYDDDLADSLSAQIQPRHEHDARIVPFNSYRFAAKALLGDLLRERLLGALRVQPGLLLARTRWPDGERPPEPGPRRDRPAELEADRDRLVKALRLEPEGGPGDDRFVVVGMGRFGRSVLRELLDATPAGARFLVVEHSEAAFRASAEHFSDEERARFAPFIGDAVGRAAIARIVEFAPGAALICTDHDLSNLRLAVDLRRHGVRAVTRMSGRDVSELSRGLDERGVTIVALSRLFRAAIPILTHERRLRACLNLDVNRTTEVDHLFYLAAVSPEERRLLGRACVSLDELPRPPDLPPPTDDLALVWHRSVKDLAV